MNCKSCELLIKTELQNIKWIKNISISFKDWNLEFESDNDIKQSTLSTIFKKHGFTLQKYGNTKKHNKELLNQTKDFTNTYRLTFEDLVHIIILIIFLGIILMFLQKTWVINNFPEMVNNMSFLMAIMVWFVASVSSCFALIWTLVIWFGSLQNVNQQDWILKRAKPHLLFHLWRILGFFILWWLLWLIGDIITISFGIRWLITILIWLVMFYIWLQILKIVPNISTFWFHLPWFIWNSIWRLNQKNEWILPLILWVLTFFLPCWFTQSMQLLAIWSWEFISGGLIMAFFAIWTMPVLLIAWISWTFTRWDWLSFFNKLVWVIIVFFSLYSIINSLNLISGFFSDDNLDSVVSWSQILEDWKNEIDDQTMMKVNSDWDIKYEKVFATHNWWGIDGDIIELKSWWNYELIITPKQNWAWCMSTMVAPQLDGIVYRVIKWQPIIYKISNAQKWTYKLVCATMWMYQGEINIR